MGLLSSQSESDRDESSRRPHMPSTQYKSFLADCQRKDAPGLTIKVGAGASFA